MLNIFIASLNQAAVVCLNGVTTTDDWYRVKNQKDGSTILTFAGTQNGVRWAHSFSDENLQKSRFNDVTSNYELYDLNGKFLTLSMRTVQALTKSNNRLHTLTQKVQFNCITEEELLELEAFAGIV